MAKVDCLVSVVAPVCNDAGIVAAFIRDVHRVLAANYTYYEIVLVDDHSTDDTVARIDELLEQVECIRLIRLSRRLGFENAITAGLDSAIGDFVVTMSPDTDPAEDIPHMVELSRRGKDVVTGIPANRPSRGPLFGPLWWLFNLLARWFIPVALPSDPNTSFRVLSRQAVNAVTRIDRKRRFIVVLVSEIGYPSATFSYNLISRSGRRPGLKLLAAIYLGTSIIVHNSNRPLRLVSLVGVIGSFLSTAYALYVVVINLVKNKVMEGWTTLSLQVSGLFLLVFMCFTLISIYMERILEESANRPLYNVMDERHSSVMMADETRRNILEQSTDDAAAGGKNPA